MRPDGDDVEHNVPPTLRVEVVEGRHEIAGIRADEQEEA